MIKAIVEFFSTRDPDTGCPEHDLQLAAAALMVEIGRADGHLSEVEIETLVQVCQRRFGLDDVETAELLATAGVAAEDAVSLQGLTRVLNDCLGLAERIHVVELLWQVAVADGQIDRYEDFYVRKISDLLHVPHGDFVRGRLKALGEVLD